VLTCLVWARVTQVLHESLLVFPTLGIQLETHRGHPLFPTLSTTHHFIPLSALEDVVLHEGFRRWDVRYYLAALKRTRGSRAYEASGAGDERAALGSGVEVRVAFENILPYFPVLKEVYLGVQQTLFPPPTRIAETDG
jgi:phosphatidylinositol glycan class H protein